MNNNPNSGKFVLPLLRSSHSGLATGMISKDFHLEMTEHAQALYSQSKKGDNTAKSLKFLELKMLRQGLIQSNRPMAFGRE